MANFPIYCKEEVATVRGYLEGRIKPKNLGSLDRPLLEKIRKEKNHMAPFLCFVKDEKELFEKICRDPRAERFSFLLFFPALEGHLDSGMGHIEEETLWARTRGWAARLKVDGKDLIIKPVQSPDEPYVAGYAGANNAGPVQYPTLANFITEEFMGGALFKDISRTLNEGEAAFAGQRVGEILGVLHKGRILFNDVIFTDDVGGCHLMVGGKDVRMLDFGVSLDLSKFPLITDEQITRYMLTLPFVGGMIQAGMVQGPALEAEIRRIRGPMSAASVKDILSRDFDFVSEGLAFSGFGSQKIARLLEKSLFDAYEKTVQNPEHKT